MYTEMEEQYAFAVRALPTPTDTPYRTPSRSRSRRSSHHGNASPVPSSSPPLAPPGGLGDPRDPANDETISILDPRRFTPTLHANLVSEILTLRRDLDSKGTVIESLETSLHDAKGRSDLLGIELSANAKENRSLKRQLQLLEGGTSSALDELSRERDEAVDNISEMKRRLDAAQKKVRSQEEDSDRVQGLWQRDRDAWEAEKRVMERKMHIVEGRLKTVLDEVAAHQAAACVSHQAPDSEAEDAGKDGGFVAGSDTASIRSMSLKGGRPMSAMSNYDGHSSLRYSMLSSVNGYSQKFAGISLADELELDEEDDQTAEDTDGGVVAPKDASPSRVSWRPKGHHRRANSSITSDRAFAENFEHSAVSSLERGIALKASERRRINGHLSRRSESWANDASIVSDVKTKQDIPEYVDTGIQYSPPQSPKIPTTLPAPAVETEKNDPSRCASPQMDNEATGANQRRKRVSISPPAIIFAPSYSSTSCQTQDDPTGLPKTPLSPKMAPSPVQQPVWCQTKSTSTQTDNSSEPLFIRRAPPPAPIPIPSIAIHPPTSAPVTPGEAILPAQYKNAYSQVSMSSLVDMKSSSMQTEEIRVDKRTVRLPPNLLPSGIRSHPPTPEPSEDGRIVPDPPTKSPRTSFRNRFEDPPSSPPERISMGSEAADSYADSRKSVSILKTARSSSLFSGFDALSSDDADEFGEPELSDNEYHTALRAAPRPRSRSQKNGRLFSKAPTSVPEGSEVNIIRRTNLSNGTLKSAMFSGSRVETTLANSQPSLGRRSMSDRSMKGKQLDKPLTIHTGPKPLNMRRSALISSGAAAHVRRSRSPSLGSPTTATGPIPSLPPFPVPTRSSSRKIPFGSSDGTQSPTPQSPLGYRKYESRRPPVKRNTIRKSRSTAALPRGDIFQRQRSRSPPAMSTSSVAPESPQLPPMPRDEITTPHYALPQNRMGHRAQSSVQTTNTAGAASVASSAQQTSVVDAIHQTMVGEWMWKYVRRRKSFGVQETPQADWDRNGEGAANITGNGIRHKRWVWLAPYERAVMWSSRQPTSGTALLGKSGRKLAIQSVLDVRDDTPVPKGAGSTPLFNRSILILTPARALKFTAPTKERHYVWLTALSFLSHSSQSANDLVSIPPIPQQEYEPPPPQRPHLNGLNRHPIRDSIRVAKGRGKTYAADGGSSLRTNNTGSNHTTGMGQDSIPESAYFSSGMIEPIADAAEPPHVPRFHREGGHGRKRSNTGSKLPNANTFRAFSHSPMPSSNLSIGTNASSEFYTNSLPGGMSGMQISSGRSSFSRRTPSENGSVPPVPMMPTNNFFDAVGTMRMEAFVDKSVSQRFDPMGDEVGNGPGHSSYRQSRGVGTRRRVDRGDYGNVNTHGNGGLDMFGHRMLDDSEDFFRSDDPFGGF
ncbi:MAG: hypothetical protein M1829_004998 [Trizodia sp. TS-e1964]|nr:MAG: hypothetical protein M1829_004998 [Trizodia sp. TS-e1964]